MKKVLAIVVVVILLAIAGYLWNRRNTSQPNEATTNTTPISENTAPQTKDASSVIGSIKDAMGLGKKLKCTYSDATGTGATSTVFIDGQKIKYSAAVDGKTTGSGIFDGDTQYTWFTTGGINKGFKMTKVCMDEMKKLNYSAPSSDTPTPEIEDYSSIFDNAKNISCEPAGDEDFLIPADIEFIDQCEMIRSRVKALEHNRAKALEQIPQSMPKTPAVPSGY